MYRKIFCKDSPNLIIVLSHSKPNVVLPTYYLIGSFISQAQVAQPARLISADRQRRKRDAMMIDDSTTEVTYPENFICPISFDLMTDPLVSIYGHHYQREAIIGWLSQGNNTCPLTRNPLTLGMLVSDSRLRSNIRGWMLRNGLAFQRQNEQEAPARVVGLGCILAPSKRQLHTLITRQIGPEPQRRPHRFLNRLRRRTPPVSRFA